MEQNKAKERFTKTWVIEQHRKMWRWIAEQIKSGALEGTNKIWEYKKEYLKQYKRPNNLSVHSYCFCCMFARYEKSRVIKKSGEHHRACDFCPLELSGCIDYNELITTEMGKINTTKEKKQHAIQLCERIAEAPERKE